MYYSVRFTNGRYIVVLVNSDNGNFIEVDLGMVFTSFDEAAKIANKMTNLNYGNYK